MGFSAVFLVILAGGLVTAIYLIAADKRRFLVRFELEQWREPYYLRALPNFLQSLHDHHFTSPFPAQRNAVATAYFRYRARPLLKRRPAHLRRAFLQQHIVLFALLENLRPFIQDFLYSEQQRIVGDRILEMEDTIERDRLIAYLDCVRRHRARFFATLDDADRQTLIEMVNRRLLQTLRAAHAIYQEHGYSLLPAFTQLRQWADMSGTELVQELPPPPAPLQLAVR